MMANPISLSPPTSPLPPSSPATSLYQRTTTTSPSSSSPSFNNNSPRLVPSPSAYASSSSSRPTLTTSSDISSLPLTPLPHHLLPFLLPTCSLSAAEKRKLFTSTYLRCASLGHADTLEWLLSVPESTTSAAARRFSSSSLSSVAGPSPGGEILPDESPRKWVNVEARDEDGNTALGLCVALGHAEGVRVLVEGGASVSGGDNAGWTPLHWAAQNNDIPIAAYLLNHRASPTVASHKGLTPKDLVKRGRDGLVMREILKGGEEAEAERVSLSVDLGSTGDGDKGKGLEDRPESRASSVASSSRPPGWASVPEKAEEQAREQELLKRMELARSSALHLELDLGVLTLTGTGTEQLSDDEEDEGDDPPAPFVWSKCLPDQMLVFSIDDLGVLFDVIITNMKPVRIRKYRVTPANVILFCARFAHYYGSQEMMEELFLGAIERIETAVHARPDDMTNCAFWLSNSLLLLYYLRKEPNLFLATSEYQVHLSDLINEIFVFVIRDAERRIDRILEPAILEHEPLPGFKDLLFEGEWGSNQFMKKLTGRGKKSMSKSASMKSLFEEASESNSPPPPTLGGPATPRSITSLLSSTLFILQLYEIPPSIIVQAFSQLFYWVACEIFNRLLTQKKFLCRSRAVQIRLNASMLEEWARLNRMPSKMTSVHFAPINQLLQWLQCLSSEATIDSLIGTIQSLRSLNPLQLRRAVREYRYEVDESKIGEDCEQYLLQIQKQWERMRVQKKVEELEAGSDAHRSISPDGSQVSVQSDVVKMIDEVFSDPSNFGHYTPPGGSEALGELLNSRYMLPFAVPSAAEMLVNFRSKDAFGPFATADTGTPRSNVSSRPSSGVGDHASDTSSVAGTSFDSDEGITPVVPDDFFAVLDAAKEQALRTTPGGFSSRGGDGLGLALDGGGIRASRPGTSVQFDWRATMPKYEEEGDDEEGSPEVGVQETPRPRSGFASS